MCFATVVQSSRLPLASAVVSRHLNRQATASAECCSSIHTGPSRRSDSCCNKYWSEFRDGRVKPLTLRSRPPLLGACGSSPSTSRGPVAFGARHRLSKAKRIRCGVSKNSVLRFIRTVGLRRSWQAYDKGRAVWFIRFDRQHPPVALDDPVTDGKPDTHPLVFCRDERLK
jgi:hypothetical protein